MRKNKFLASANIEDVREQHLTHKEAAVYRVACLALI